MTRLPASALEEGEQIHAILGPLLTEHGAAKRRAEALAADHGKRAVSLNELDLVIELLNARMRVDPRPGKGGRRETAVRPVTREGAAAAARHPQELEIPAIPTGKGPAAGTPRPTDEIPPLPAAADQQVTRPEVPPPVPPGPLKAKEGEPGRKQEAPPPVPAGAKPRPTAARAAQKTPADPTAGPPPVPPKRAVLPVRDASEVKGPVVAARPGDAPETFLLYDDIVTLSGMNDRDGLLISLERMLLLARLENHIQVFIEANESKLVGLYESQMKSFTRVPTRRAAAVDNTMPAAFLRGEKVAKVLPLVDGKATIAEIVERAKGLHRLETLSVLAQLQRSGIIEVP